METIPFQAVGLVEFTSIAAGVEAADRMVKAASVEPLMLKTVCPGKFVAGVFGDVAGVEAAVAAGCAGADGALADHFVIPNITPGVVSALSCCAEPAGGDAVGIIETFSVASTIVAADIAAKSANVQIAEVRMAMGLGGKAFCLLTGDVAAVAAAVEAGSREAASGGLLVRTAVIPAIAPQVLRYLV